MSKTKTILTLLLCVVAQVVMAQSKVISGTVEDALGPVMMANVTERDGNNRIVNATQTDMMGNFSMEIKNPKNKLVISYVGSKTQTLAIGDKTTFAIKLEDEKTTLNEVTIRGRRTNSGGLNINKKEITTAQQVFDLTEVEGMAFTSADEALQGEIAGLDIVSNSGNLGSGTTMRLRGVTTINGNAEPLIVVDDKISIILTRVSTSQRLQRKTMRPSFLSMWRISQALLSSKTLPQQPSGVLKVLTVSS